MKTLSCIAACLSVFLVGCQKQTTQTLPQHLINVSTQQCTGITLHNPDPAESAAQEFTPVPENTNLYDIVFDDVPLLEVVRQFTEIPGVPIIATPSELRGRMTVRLTGVRWRPALQSILKLHGFQLMEYTPGSGVYSIVERPVGQPEPLITETFLFSTPEEAAEIANAIRDVWGSDSTGTIRVGAIPSRKAVILTATLCSHAEIRRMLEASEPGKLSKH